MADLAEALRAAEAPPLLIGWAQAQGDLASAWAQCPNPPWQVWLAGVAGVELGAALAAIAEWARELAELVPEAAPLARQVLLAADGGLGGQASREACVAAAEAAETAARQPPETFRHRLPAAYAPLARGVAWLARSVEGLQTAAVRAEAERMQRAQTTASYLGAGINAVLGKPAPLRLDVRRAREDALHAELLYVVAAAAEAAEGLAEASTLLAASGARERPLGTDRLRALLDPAFGDLSRSRR